MTVAITATRNENIDNPGFEINLTGLFGVTNITVTRRSLSGTYSDQTVHGAEAAAVSGISTFLVSDYEAPLYDDFTYVAHCVGGTPVDVEVNVTGYPSATTLVRPGSAYLKNPYLPSISMPMLVLDFTTTSRAGRVLSKTDVLGRRNPVILTDVPSGRTGTMQLATFMDGETFDGLITPEIEEMELLLDSGAILLFQTAYPYTGERDIYIVVDSFTRERLTKDIKPFGPLHSWTINFIEVDRPSAPSDPLSGITWAEVNSTYATFGALNATFATWYDVVVS